VRLEGRELEAVWASAHRSRMSGPVRAARRREALGLPRVSDREAEQRLRDNRACTARRHRAAARAREGATATLGAPKVPVTPVGPEVRDMGQEQRHAARAASSRSSPKREPTATAQVGGARQVYSPCERCAHCRCRQPRDYSADQDSRFPRAVVQPPVVATHLPDQHPAATPVRHTPRRLDHLSCGARPSRTRGPLTPRAPQHPPGMRPRHSSAWGRRP